MSLFLRKATSSSSNLEIPRIRILSLFSRGRLSRSVVEAIFITIILPKIDLVLPYGRVHSLAIPFNGLIIIIVVMDRYLCFLLRMRQMVSVRDLGIEIFL